MVKPLVRLGAVLLLGLLLIGITPAHGAGSQLTHASPRRTTRHHLRSHKTARAARHAVPVSTATLSPSATQTTVPTPTAPATAAPTATHTPLPLLATPTLAGCNQGGTPGATVAQTLSYGGVSRTDLLHLPVTYQSTTPAPLVLALPGSGMTAVDEAVLSHLARTADATGVVVVFPQATGAPLQWNTGAWGNPSTADDVGYLSALVTTLEGQVCVDAHRIAALGMSNGGAMAYHLACADLPWLAAIGVVAGTLPQSPSTCQMAHPTPLIAFHGEHDPVVGYEGGAMGLVPAIPTVVATWAGMNGCAPLPMQAAIADVTTFAYGACAAGADTVLYAVQDGGHTWPGGVPLPALGPTTTAVDASSLALAFFKAHPAA